MNVIITMVNKKWYKTCIANAESDLDRIVYFSPSNRFLYSEVSFFILYAAYDMKAQDFFVIKLFVDSICPFRRLMTFSMMPIMGSVWELNLWVHFLGIFPYQNSFIKKRRANTTSSLIIPKLSSPLEVKPNHFFVNLVCYINYII